MVCMVYSQLKACCPAHKVMWECESVINHNHMQTGRWLYSKEEWNAQHNNQWYTWNCSSSATLIRIQNVLVECVLWLYVIVCSLLDRLLKGCTPPSVKRSSHAKRTNDVRMMKVHTKFTILSKELCANPCFHGVLIVSSLCYLQEHINLYLASIWPMSAK